MQHHVLREVQVSVLPNGDLVVSGKQENFLRSLELFQVAEILSVNPNSGSFFDFGGALQLKLAQHFVSRVGSLDKNRQAGNRQSAATFSNSHVLGISVYSKRWAIFLLTFCATCHTPKLSS